MNSKLLLNPFAKIAGLPSLLLGIAGVLIAGYISYYSGTYFDGIFNAHVVNNGSLINHLLWPFISVAIVALWFLIWALILRKSQWRAIDVVGTQFFAFIPMLPVSLLGFSPGLNHFTELIAGVTPENIQQLNFPGNLIVQVSIVLFFTLLFTVWSAIYMYKGYKISTNMPHVKVVPVYISGIIIGMVMPRLIMGWIF